MTVPRGQSRCNVMNCRMLRVVEDESEGGGTPGVCVCVVIMNEDIVPDRGSLAKQCNALH